MAYILSFIFFILLMWLVTFLYLRSKVRTSEAYLIGLYNEKIGKIPAIIETMRPYVADEKVFEALTRLHRDAMVSVYDSMYDVLVDNLQIQREFEFLMKLSARIPEIQKKEYFLYMRDYIIKYERQMKSYLGSLNRAIQNYNRFVCLKNMTIIGYILPGEKMHEIL